MVGFAQVWDSFDWIHLLVVSERKFYNALNIKVHENPAIYCEVLNDLSPVVIRIAFPLNEAFAYIKRTKANVFLKTI